MALPQASYASHFENFLWLFLLQKILAANIFTDCPYNGHTNMKFHLILPMNDICDFSKHNFHAAASLFFGGSKVSGGGIRQRRASLVVRIVRNVEIGAQ